MSRRNFPRDVIRAAWARCIGEDGLPHCESCGALLWHGNVNFDHVKPDGLKGEPTLANCMALCRNCHDIKTHTIDRPIMQKADNQQFASLKQRKPWHPGFRKRMNGSVEPR